jgi:hypothetical protein
MLGFVQVVPLFSSKQYPSVPRVIVPLKLSKLIEALRKKIDLRRGTLNETTARRIVAMSVTRKPGVAGRKIIVKRTEENGQR